MTSRMKRREFLQRLTLEAAALGGVGLRTASARAEPGPAGARSRAWVGATLWVGDGQVLADAALLIDGERIVAAGKSVSIPAGAEIVQARGRVLAPGWIAVESPLGLVEIEQEPSTLDAAPRHEEQLEAIHAAYSAADAYNPLSTLIGVARQGGVTSAISTPEGGLVSGTSAWVDLIDRFPGPDLVREDVALHANVSELRKSTRPLALSRLREALESARLYARSPHDYDRGQTRPLGLSALDLRRLAQVLDGALPLVVRAARGSDMLRLLELGAGYQLRLIFAGAEEAWTVADQIAHARVPVVINPLENLPQSFSQLNTRRDNAALLERAGVPLLFSTFSAYTLHNLRQLAGNAVAFGTSRAAATRALAYEPSRSFGLDGEYGQLIAGRLANFCVWNGDPFELTSWAEEVVIRGRSTSTRSRQTELFERYRDLSRVPRGTSGLPPPSTEHYLNASRPND
jgi:imidazolonepropionase-like amidohydrolase